MLGLSIGLCLGPLLAAGGCATRADLAVFAAASTQNALADVTREFAEQYRRSTKIAPGGSSALAQQIRHGAPADVYISANPGWMDSLEREGMIEAESRFDLLSNSLVLIARGRDAEAVEIDPELDLAGMLADERIAMAFVDAAPAGIYGKAALGALGLWDSVAPRLVQTGDVRGALALVATGQARLGIVYGTDAMADDNVAVIGTFPAGSHPPIRYPAAAVTASRHPERSAFLRFLRGPWARTVFEGYGFGFIAGQ